MGGNVADLEFRSKWNGGDGRRISISNIQCPLFNFQERMNLNSRTHE
jgi:hypothetical protein